MNRHLLALAGLLLAVGSSQGQTGTQPAASEGGARQGPVTSADLAEARVAEYRQLLREDLAPLKVLREGMTSEEVRKLFPSARSETECSTPTLTFPSANGRKIRIYFHKGTGQMSLVNVYLWARDKPSEVSKQTLEQLRAGIGARWSREDVAKLMGIPDHLSAVLNDFWQYGSYSVRFGDDVLQSAEPPPQPAPLQSAQVATPPAPGLAPSR